MASLLRRVVWLLEDGRIRDALQLTAHVLSERYYERRHGIYTAGTVAAADLDVRNPDVSVYMPTDYRGFKRAMGKIAIDPRQDVFLDMGSGMGRVLVLAATYPFLKVIGVEASGKLNSIALENLRRAHRLLRCLDVQVVQVDAADYAVPPEVTCIYFYNPFGNASFSQVLANIRASFQKTPRTMKIIYKNPACSAALQEASGWLHKRAEYKAYGGPFCIYEVGNGEGRIR